MHVVLCGGVWWCAVLCGGGGGVVRCVGVVLVLCWCVCGVCVSFLSFFSFFSFSLFLSLFLSLSFRTLCKEPINQQTSRRSDVIWRTLVRG